MYTSMFAIFCFLIAGLANAFLTISIELSENTGASWIQTLFFQELTALILIVLFWLFYSFGVYYHSPSKTYFQSRFPTFTSYLITIFPHKPLQHHPGQQHNDRSMSNNIFATNANNSTYVYNDPELSTQWIVLFTQGMFGLAASISYNISIQYCDNGDVLFIQTATTTLIELLFGWIFFGEEIHCLTVIAFISCVGGLVLVTHPSFISHIDGYSSNETVDDGVILIDAIKLMFILVSGLCYACYGSVG